MQESDSTFLIGIDNLNSYHDVGLKEYRLQQLGGVPVTYADTGKLERDYGFKPRINLREGLRAFAEWYREFSSSRAKELDIEKTKQH